MPDYTDIIDELAANPRVIETEGIKIEEQSIGDVLRAQQATAANEGIVLPHRGIYFTKLISRGPV